MSGDLKSRLEADIGEPLVGPVHGGVVRSVSGREFYLKTGSPSPAYRCEANGLKELAASRTVAVAAVVSAGESYIATEYIRTHSPQGGFFEKFGRDLARMHRTSAPRFGFREDNFIGANPQPNIPDGAESSDWTAFFFNKRLLFQFRLAERNGRATRRMAAAFGALESRIGAILAGSDEPPALLHGDLWAGNFLCGADNEAVLIDPAVYYGHREAELAMTRLFGGFPREFYEAYQREYPLKPGWEEREPLYRLYHVMNHLNLFGSGYLGQTEAILERYSS